MYHFSHYPIATSRISIYIYIAVKLFLYCTVPSRVTGVAVSKAIRSGKPALRVTWTTPQSDVTISQYQVEYRGSGTNWRAVSPVSPGSATSTLLETLDAGTVYEVRIRTVSAIGNGTWSRVESETTYTSELCSEVKVAETANIDLMWVLLTRHQPYCCKEVVSEAYFTQLPDSC